MFSSVGLPVTINVGHVVRDVVNISLKVADIGVSTLEKSASYMERFYQAVRKGVVHAGDSITERMAASLRKRCEGSIRAFYSEHHPKLTSEEIEEIIREGDAKKVFRKKEIRKENPHFTEERIKEYYEAEQEMTKKYDEIYQHLPLAKITGLVIPTKEMQKKMLQNRIKSCFEQVTGSEITPVKVPEDDWEWVPGLNEEVKDFLFYNAMKEIKEKVISKPSLTDLLRKGLIKEAIFKILLVVARFLVNIIFSKEKLFNFYNGFIEYVLDEKRLLHVINQFVDVTKKQTDKYRKIIALEKRREQLLKKSVRIEKEQNELHKLENELKNFIEGEEDFEKEKENALGLLKQKIAKSQFSSDQKKVPQVLLKRLATQTTFDFVHKKLTSKFYSKIDFPSSRRDLYEKTFSLSLYLTLVNEFFKDGPPEVDETSLNQTFLDLVSNLGRPILSKWFEKKENVNAISDIITEDGDEVSEEELEEVNDIRNFYVKALSSQGMFEYIVRGKYSEFIEKSPLIRKMVVALDPLDGQRKEILGLSEVVKISAKSAHEALQSIVKQAVQDRENPGIYVAPIVSDLASQIQ